MKQKILSKIPLFVVLIFVVDFIIRFSGPEILKWYVSSGLGTCQEVPVLCIVPEQEKVVFSGDKEFRAGLVPFRITDMEMYAPKKFTVIKEQIKKVYYKRKPRHHKGQVIYVLYQPPDFFMDLFPQLKERGVKDDFDFFTRTMNAQLSSIEDTTDAFFVIIKSLFTAGMGEDQSGLKIIEFEGVGKKGFIIHNSASGINYFDCNIFTEGKDFFKCFIKDEESELTLQNVLTILGTVKNISS